MNIIRKSRRVSETYHQLHFEDRTCPGAGFSFPCNAVGEVDTESLNPVARENFARCLDGTHDVEPRGVQTYRHNYTEPAVGRCSCGAEVELYGFTNTCGRCGADYNFAGQLLADRRLWDGTDGAGSYDYA